MKKEVLDESSCGLGGRWYTQQAIRAINQAVGRIVRHKSDYGSIVLIDQRFVQDYKKLSGWVVASVNSRQK